MKDIGKYEYHPLSVEGEKFFNKHKEDITKIVAKFSWVKKAYIDFSEWTPVYYFDGEYKEGHFPDYEVRDSLIKYYLSCNKAFNSSTSSVKWAPETKKLFYNAEEYRAKEAAEKARIAEELKKEREGLDVNGRIELYEEEVLLAIKQAFVEMAGIFISQKQQKLAASEDGNIKLLLNSVSFKECGRIATYYELKFNTDNETLVIDWDQDDKEGSIILNPEMLFDKVLPKLREYVLNEYGNIVSPEDSEQVKAMKSILGNEEIYNSLIARDNTHKFLLAAKNNDEEGVLKLLTDQLTRPSKLEHIVDIITKANNILNDNSKEIEAVKNNSLNGQLSKNISWVEKAMRGDSYRPKGHSI